MHTTVIKYCLLFLLLWLNLSQALHSERNLPPSEDGILLETSCKFWAKQCVLLTAEAVSDYLCKPTLNPMAALGYFLTRTGHEIPHHHASNATLTMLFSKRARVKIQQPVITT